MTASDTGRHHSKSGWGIDFLVVGALALIAMLGIALLGSDDGDIITETDTNSIEPAEVRANDEDKPLQTLPPYPAAPDGAGFITLMGDNLNADVWYVSKHENKTGFYGADWKIDNVTVANQGTGLSVHHPEPDQVRPTAAEIQTLKPYGFGTYEAMLRPAQGSGIVTAFFTYTGPYFGNPHDEIDFEFLGADLTKVHLNYWRNGATGKSKTLKLGFNAGEAAHLYAFDWQADRIVWSVDGKVIHTTKIDDPFIPVTPGNIYFSTWTGKKTMQAWHGRPTFEDGTETEISCVSFVPMNGEGRSCSDFYLPRQASTEAPAHTK